MHATDFQQLCREHPDMPALVFDWCQRRKIPTLAFGETEVIEYTSIFAMLDDLEEPHIIIAETTFESFVITRRQEFIDRCEAEGHILRTVPTRATGRWRVRVAERSAGRPLTRTEAKAANKKTSGKAGDRIDLEALKYEAQFVHLKRPVVLDREDAFVLKREAANRELQQMRADVWPVIGPRGGVSFDDAKTQFAKDVSSKLPRIETMEQPANYVSSVPFEELRPTLILALCDGGSEYNTVIVAAVAMAAKYANSRTEFERLTGLFGDGYPSQIRSDLQFHGWAGSTRAKINTESGPDHGKRYDGLTFSQYRRAMRWLYRQIKNL